MLGTYFYHEIIRKAIIGFGTLFNDVYIKHLNKDGSVADETKVGLSYGPSQKFLAKIQQQAELSKYKTTNHLFQSVLQWGLNTPIAIKNGSPFTTAYSRLAIAATVEL